MLAINSRKRFAAIFGTAVFVLASISAAAQTYTYALNMQNNTVVNIKWITVVPYTNSSVVSTELLKGRTLYSGQNLNVDVPPGEYGLVMVDEFGGTCAIERFEVYRNLEWTLTNSWLLTCEQRTHSALSRAFQDR